MCAVRWSTDRLFNISNQKYRPEKKYSRGLETEHLRSLESIKTIGFAGPATA